MRLDPRRLLRSLLVAAVFTVVVARPWSGATDPRDLWGVLGGVLVAWAVVYRAWPAFAELPPRVLLTRLLPGLVVGVAVVSLVVPLLSQGMGWWSEARAAWIVVAACLAAAVIDLATRRVQRRA